MTEVPSNIRKLAERIQQCRHPQEVTAALCAIIASRSPVITGIFKEGEDNSEKRNNG